MMVRLSALEMEIRRGTTRRSHVEALLRANGGGGVGVGVGGGVGGVVGGGVGVVGVSVRVAELAAGLAGGASRLLPPLLAAGRPAQAAAAAGVALGALERGRGALRALQRYREGRARGEGEGLAESQELGPVCTASLSVSGVAVVALLRLGAQVLDTEAEITTVGTRSLSLSTPLNFEEVDHDFCLTLEVYSSCLGLVGSDGRDWRPCEGQAETRRHGNRDTGTQRQREVKYVLVAQTTLTLQDVQPHLATHQLIPTSAGVSPCLPVASCVSLRLSALPVCVSTDSVSGWLSVQRAGSLWSRLHCVVRRSTLCCFYSPLELQAAVEPTEILHLTRDMAVHASERGSVHRLFSITLTPSSSSSPATTLTTTLTTSSSPATTLTTLTTTLTTSSPATVPGTIHLQVDSRSLMRHWEIGLRKHLRDMARWGECAETAMVMAAPVARKPYFTTSCTTTTTTTTTSSSSSSSNQQHLGAARGSSHSPEAPPPWAALFEQSPLRLVEHCGPASPLASASPRLADPRPTSRRLVEPRPRQTSPRLAEPRRTSPRLAEPSPRPTAHGLVEPRPRRTSPRLAEPRRTSPRLAEPRRTSPRLAEPRRTSPRLVEPRRTSPRLVEPRRTSPRLVEPRRTSPRLAEPPTRGTSPRLAEPRRTSPRLAEPRAAKRRAPPPPLAPPPYSLATPPVRAAPPLCSVATPPRRVAPPIPLIATPPRVLANGAVATPILCVAPPRGGVAPPPKPFPRTLM
uniref:Rhotekin-2-like isoform X2 n=1 Tax=Petromyzon marinus TaxID=7757 RepID=A0AAJ7SKJ5_PETMA|nr:rhotekin-2-like isoform X2 [Petromyzon marinus]